MKREDIFGMIMDNPIKIIIMEILSITVTQLTLNWTTPIEIDIVMDKIQKYHNYHETWSRQISQRKW